MIRFRKNISGGVVVLTAPVITELRTLKLDWKDFAYSLGNDLTVCVTKLPRKSNPHGKT